MTLARRVFPNPWLSASLAGFWVIANGSLDGGTVIPALLFGVLLPQFTARFWPDTPGTIHVRPLVRLMLRVFWDIIVANVRVARLVLGPNSRLRPAFLVVPLDVRHPYAITALSSIITLTPGTVSTNVSGDRRSLLIHALDVEHAESDIQRIKERYERPLLEVFPC